MTAESALREWATAHASVGLVQATQVLEMLDALAAERAEVERLREQIRGHCERIAAQSEILSRRAERST